MLSFYLNTRLQFKVINYFHQILIEPWHFIIVLFRHMRIKCKVGIHGTLKKKKKDSFFNQDRVLCGKWEGFPTRWFYIQGTGRSTNFPFLGGSQWKAVFIYTPFVYGREERRKWERGQRVWLNGRGHVSVFSCPQILLCPQVMCCRLLRFFGPESQKLHGSTSVWLPDCHSMG